MTGFVLVGILGVVLLVVALLIGDHLDGALESVGGGGLFSTEALAGFLGALGFGGAIAQEATGSTGLALVIGVVLGVLLGGLAGWVSSKLHTDDPRASVRTSDLLEKTATVLNPIPADGYGQVSLSVGGHVTRVNARSSAEVPAGTTVVVVSVLSPTSVQVEPLFLP